MPEQKKARLIQREMEVGEHALLQFQRHSEEAEQHQPYEHVVDRERLLDQVARHELQRLLVRDLAPERTVEVAPQGSRKRE